MCAVVNDLLCWLPDINVLFLSWYFSFTCFVKLTCVMSINSMGTNVFHFLMLQDYAAELVYLSIRVSYSLYVMLYIGT